jgi:hypothetical protein
MFPTLKIAFVAQLCDVCYNEQLTASEKAFSVKPNMRIFNNFAM